MTLRYPGCAHLLLATFFSMVALSANVQAADSWQPVAGVPEDLPAKMRFHVVQPLADFESGLAGWQAFHGGQHAKGELAPDTAQQHHGDASLRVDYEFMGKPDYEYLQLTAPMQIPEAGYAFGFWMDNRGASLPTRLRIKDASGETHQIELISHSQTGWQFVAGALDGPSTSWGGDGNRRRDYPCQLDGILLDRPHRDFIRTGSVWIDDVALLKVRQRPATLQLEANPLPFGNLFAVGESVHLRVQGQGDRIRWNVEDFYGRPVASGEGPGTGTHVKWTLAQTGYFACRIELFRGDELLEAQRLSCAALVDGAEPARSDFLGVCSHYGQNNYPLPSMDLMQRYGIDQFRDEISWWSYETEPGRYVMPAHAASYLQRASALKMRPLIIYDYSHPAYDGGGFPNSPEAIAAFAAYAVDLTRQTRGIVDTFEVWNEWIGGCGMSGRPGSHGPEDYGRLLKPTYQAVKQAFPDVTVVGIGGEYGADCAENIVATLGAAGTRAMDGWSIHPYRYPRQPEHSDLVGEVRRIADRVAAAGVEQPAWITEIGWPTHRTSGGSDETTQAKYCVRALVLLQSTGLIEKAFWYDFKDDGTTRDDNEHNFGVVHHQQYNCAPKPAVVAMSAWIRMTGGATLAESTHIGSVHTARYHRPDGQDVLVAWTDTGTQPIKLTGQLETTVDLMGTPVPADCRQELTDTPLYLVGRGLQIQLATDPGPNQRIRQTR